MSGNRSKRQSPRALDFVLNSGSRGLDPVRSRSVMGANRFFLVAAMVCLPWALVIGMAHPPETLAPALTHLAMVCCWVMSIDLNRRRLYLGATVLGLIAPILQFAYLTWVFSTDSGFALPLLTVGALAFVLFPPAQWIGAAAITTVAAGALVRMYASDDYAERTVAVSDEWLNATSVGNLLMVVAAVSVIALFNNKYFVRERRRNDELLAEARVAARTDALTEVYNRRGISPMLSETVRSGQYAIALADLDRFKRINDRLGHAVGDVVLANVARTLVESVGSRGTVARWGGEEFLVVMPGLSLEGAMAVMEGARRAMEDEYSAEAFLEPVTISVGVAHAPRRWGKDETLRVADAKLYEAKESGRNQVLGANVAMHALD